MMCREKEKDVVFATKLGGPMTFTFGKILEIEKKKWTGVIESHGGEVIDYDKKNKYTIVLTKRGKQSCDEIQFNVRYILDCITKEKILPLQKYRLDKNVNVECCYSTPLGSSHCIFSELLQKGVCKKHRVRENQSDDKNCNLDEEISVEEQINRIENSIYIKDNLQIKSELDMSIESMENEEESQSLETQNYYADDENSQSLLTSRRK